MQKTGIITLFLLLSQVSFSQEELGLEGLISLAVENNQGLKAERLKVEKAEAMRGTAFQFDKTEVYYNYDENNIALNNRPLKVFGIQQSFQFPTVYAIQNKVQKRYYELEKSKYDIQKKALIKDLTLAYITYQIKNQKAQIYNTLDSVYLQFSYAANRRFELGETNYLEKVTSQAKHRQIAIDLSKSKQELQTSYSSILALVQTKDSLVIKMEQPNKMALQKLQYLGEIEKNYLDQWEQMAIAEKQLEINKLLPDISLEYFQGTNKGLGTSLNGFQLGLKIPILFFGQSSHIKAARISSEIIAASSNETKTQLENTYHILQSQLLQDEEVLQYFETEGAVLSEQILKAAHGGFKNGEIDFFQYIQSLENAYAIQLNYLEALHRYNQTVIAINYLTLKF